MAPYGWTCPCRKLKSDNIGDAVRRERGHRNSAMSGYCAHKRRILVLLEELEHRVGNSLQIIAAIILMKSRMVTSEETRLQLQDAHKRVMSVAAVQKHLHATGASCPVEIAHLCTADSE
jgi:two-component sensor histidine kinase